MTLYEFRCILCDRAVGTEMLVVHLVIHHGFKNGEIEWTKAKDTFYVRAERDW